MRPLEKICLGFLLIVAFIYFWAAIAGMSDVFVAPLIFDFLTVSPFDLFHAIHCNLFGPCVVSDLLFAGDPFTQDGIQFLMAIELAVSALIFFAAFFLPKGRAWARAIWVAFLTISAAAALTNVIVGRLSARAIGPIAGRGLFPGVISAAWCASYIIAYVIVLRAPARSS